MNAEQRHIYHRTAELKVAEAVHYSGCELVHGWCAVQALLSAHELADIETLIYISFYEGVEKVMWQDGPDAILLDRVQALVQTIVQHRNARNTSDLETEVEHSEIRASATSDVLPENGCRHVPYWTIYLVEEIRDGGRIINVRQNYEQGTECVYCPKCGEKL